MAIAMHLSSGQVICACCTVPTSVERVVHENGVLYCDYCYENALYKNTYCESCFVVPVQSGDKYCASCVDEIVDSLAQQYGETVRVEKGWY